LAVETERPTAPPTAAESPAPFAPQSIEETGLSAGFIGDLALKILYKSGQATGGELAEMLCIPFGPILAPILDFLKNERLTEVKGAAGVGPQAYQYVLTDAGTARAREAFDKSGYVGPAPVTLGAYVGRVRAQSIGSLKVSMEELKKALGHLVLPERTLRQLGPAINSGRSIFLFGPPGTGK